MIGWNFPLNNDGENDGLNDAGIETYSGAPIKSLAREVIQNSLDAADDLRTNPVAVNFDLSYFNNNDIPGLNDYKEILNACYHFGKNIEKTKRFFENALDVINRKKIPVLRISDFNTTGLTGAGEEGLNNWNNLIKGNGVSNKHVGAGGSFGIGKQAPFACSNLRTVFYVTKDENGVEAFQGNAKLITHKKANGKKTQGTGYYGIKNGNKPVLNFNDLPGEFYQRENVGTDIYIFAFIENDSWMENIIKSVLEHFLVAIYRNDLIVNVGDKKIDSNNLENFINEYISDDSDYYGDKYYKTLVSDEKFIFEEKNFENLGDLKFYLLPNKNFPKRVAMVRDTGMKIFDKGHFRTPKKFAGVFMAEGENLNELLRKMEPPSHDAWEPVRHPYKDKASKIKDKIYKWLNEKVGSISFDEDAEKVDIDGMSQFLPDELSELSIPGESAEEEKEKKLPENRSISSKKVDVKPTSSSFDLGSEFGDAGDSGSTGGEHGGGGETNNGRYNDESSGGEGEGGSDDDKNGTKPTVTEKPLKLRSARVFSLNPNKGIYVASITANKDAEGFLKFKVVGEDRKDNAPIKKAQITGQKSGDIDITSRGKVGPITLEDGKEVKMILHLSDNVKYSMEVDINES